MARIKVSCSELTAYGSFLETTSTEFKTLKTNMENIVASLSSSWSGYDSKNFISNATEYLKNLQSLEGTFAAHGDTIRAKSVQYNNVRAKFYDIINS